MRSAAIIIVVLLVPWVARADEEGFDLGSLIIPMQSEHQSECGSASAYGLVYRLLQNRVPVYWIINPEKKSQDRCRNADSSAIWNDGCDMRVSAAPGAPVSLVDSPTATWGKFATAPWAPPPSAGAPSVIKYKGGPFVISAAHAAAALKLLQTHPDFALFRTPCSCGGLPVAQDGCHYVTIHRAETGFRAPVARIMHEVPPLVALLGSGAASVLRRYLANAGLDYLGAGGTFDSHGRIYDILEPNIDFVSTPTYPLGRLNAKDPADPTGRTYVYRVLWAPHWVGRVGDGVGDGAPGDAQVGDGAWTDAVGRNDLENTLANIALFSERRGATFAECAAIETFEGSWRSSVNCVERPVGCKDALGSVTPFACPSGYQLGPDNVCYQCSTGTFDRVKLLCVDACPSGAVPDGNACVGCRSGYSYDIDSAVCRSNCPAGAAAISDTQCMTCPKGYTLDAAASKCSTAAFCTTKGYTVDFLKDMCVLPGKSDLPISCPKGAVYSPANNRCEAGPTLSTRASSNPIRINRDDIAPTGATAATCSAGLEVAYQDVCTNSGSASLDVPGSPGSRFMTTSGLDKNGLNSFAGPDCASPSYTGGDCFSFRAAGNPLAQIGDFTFEGTGGHIHNFRPSLAPTPASTYRDGVLRFVSSGHSTDANRRNWDFFTFRFKDNNTRKGPIVYLAGHSFAGSSGGTRLVLNTLLNLAYTLDQVELSRSEPVGRVEQTPGGPRVLLYSGTYLQRSPPGPFTWWQAFSPARMDEWRFPYIEGLFRELDFARLPAGEKLSFGTGTNWEASERLPSPGDRRIYTWVAAPAPGMVRNAAPDSAWKRVDFDFRSLGADCVKAPGLTNTCELARQVAVADFAAIETDATALASAVDATKHFVQKVRGFCVAHRGAADPLAECHSFAPGTTQDPAQAGLCTGVAQDDCDQQDDSNRAALGGIDHSAAAVIGPSRYVSGPRGRPTVAFVGARDGMLHAFYIGGGAGYTGLDGTAAPFVPPLPGTELWAILPPGQLPKLRTNDAMVDASPVVSDVFADFRIDLNGDGDLADPGDLRPDGRREWRTVLTVAAGRGGSEILALDVSDPLRPALLWSIQPALDADDTGLVSTDAGTIATKYVESASAPANYDAPSGTGTPPVLTGRYNYSDLGMAETVSLGLTRRDGLTRFEAFVASNSGKKGVRALELFAIDLATGAKRWQFERLYEGADNSSPPGVSVYDLDNDGFSDRIYAGAMDGTLWELHASTGRNVNFVAVKDGPRRSFPLYATADPNQPISTLATVFRFGPGSPAADHMARGHLALAFGTGGTDWVLARDPRLRGTLTLVPIDPIDLRFSAPLGSLDASTASVRGVTRPEAVVVKQLSERERLYGPIRIAGDGLVASSSFGSLEGDIASSRFDEGNTLRFGGDGVTTILSSAGKTAAAVLVEGNTAVVTQSVNGIEVSKSTEAWQPSIALGERRRLPVRVDGWFELERRRAR